jgi:hypothetical protein
MYMNVLSFNPDSFAMDFTVDFTGGRGRHLNPFTHGVTIRALTAL